MGKSQVNLPQMPPDSGGICIGVDKRNYQVAPGLSPGWRVLNLFWRSGPCTEHARKRFPDNSRSNIRLLGLVWVKCGLLGMFAIRPTNLIV